MVVVVVVGVGVGVGVLAHGIRSGYNGASLFGSKSPNGRNSGHTPSLVDIICSGNVLDPLSSTLPPLLKQRAPS